MAVRLLEPRVEYGEAFTQVPNTVALDESLSGLAKATYLALASFAWQEGECWPSQMALAKRAGMSRRQVIRCLEELRQAGYIEQNESEQRATLTYRLLPVREQQRRTLRPAPVPYSTDESETGGCATQAQGYDSQAQGVCHTGTGGYDSQAHKEYTVEEDAKKNAAAGPSLVERVCAELQCDGDEDAERVVESAIERFPDYDHLSEALRCRTNSRENWGRLKRQLRANRYYSRLESRSTPYETKTPPQSTAGISTSSQPERIPLPVEPVDCPEVPAWGKLVNHLYGQFQAKQGQAPAEHPRAWTIFGCRPLPADSTSAVLALETHEPPDVAAELAKDVKWWLAGACLGGMQVRVTSRWAS